MCNEFRGPPVGEKQASGTRHLVTRLISHDFLFEHQMQPSARQVQTVSVATATIKLYDKMLELKGVLYVSSMSFQSIQNFNGSAFLVSGYVAPRETYAAHNSSIGLTKRENNNKSEERINREHMGVQDPSSSFFTRHLVAISASHRKGRPCLAGAPGRDSAPLALLQNQQSTSAVHCIALRCRQNYPHQS